jgi:threonine dehydrogenase-like Zn-dependent dehydrogenase
MGEVVELGSAVKNVNIGDRVVVPFTISCGTCFFCSRSLSSLCDNSNPNHWSQVNVLKDLPMGG